MILTARRRDWAPNHVRKIICHFAFKNHDVISKQFSGDIILRIHIKSRKKHLQIFLFYMRFPYLKYFMNPLSSSLEVSTFFPFLTYFHLGCLNKKIYQPSMLLLYTTLCHSSKQQNCFFVLKRLNSSFLSS